LPGSDSSDNGEGRISQRGKVINLQGHQAAEQALDTVLSADPRSPDFERLVMGAAYLGAPIPAAIVRRLDSSRPGRLYILGRVAAVYPLRVQLVQTLLRATADRRNSDNRRMGAIMLLSQHLGVQPAEDFLLSLRNPAASAATFLMANLIQYGTRPDMLLGCFRALASLPFEVLLAMLNLLSGAPGREAVHALQLLALQPDGDISQAASEALCQRDDPDALRALAILEPNLSGEAAHIVGRHLHKLRLSGAYDDPLLPAGEECRAILSPVDIKGVPRYPQPSRRQGRAGAVALCAVREAGQRRRAGFGGAAPQRRCRPG
jgi:hypothetical protein